MELGRPAGRSPARHRFLSIVRVIVALYEGDMSLGVSEKRGGLKVGRSSCLGRAFNPRTARSTGLEPAEHLASSRCRAG